MCCWNFFGCGCRCGCWNYNNNYGYNKDNDYGNCNCKDGYDGHKDHHSGCKCKHEGYSNY